MITATYSYSWDIKDYTSNQDEAQTFEMWDYDGIMT